MGCQNYLPSLNGFYKSLKFTYVLGWGKEKLLFAFKLFGEEKVWHFLEWKLTKKQCQQGKKHKERSRVKIPRTKSTNRQVHIQNKETERKARVVELFQWVICREFKS